MSVLVRFLLWNGPRKRNNWTMRRVIVCSNCIEMLQSAAQMHFGCLFFFLLLKHIEEWTAASDSRKSVECSKCTTHMLLSVDTVPSILNSIYVFLVIHSQNVSDSRIKSIKNWVFLYLQICIGWQPLAAHKMHSVDFTSLRSQTTTRNLEKNYNE